ncbi:MAG: DEAD/DEAH box helicase family protein, partial [Treponema sp.]|nr:DEAD/DEAH box helicase family protein [Treponema sp.]
MADPFFDQPILNSPYACPSRHWELDAQGQPTQKISEGRRRAAYITPIPKPRKQKGAPKQKGGDQGLLVFDEGKNLSSAAQMYDPIPVINAIRSYVDAWRRIPNPADWKVTPETARLLQHWRGAGQRGQASNFRPFFCQVEAVETLIWLTEVVPQLGKKENVFLDHLKNANAEANAELFRIALKMATGSGKTTVMAMIIAWQAVNSIRRPQSKRFTRGFLIITPGITIRDRLRVLHPSDPDNYYEHRSLLPHDMIPDIKKAKIVITNYHAFMLREKMNLMKGTRSFLQGHRQPIKSTETEGQMIRRVMQELMHIKNIMVINDEAHHCYRERPDGEDTVDDLKGDEKEEAKENNEAARVWINGIETVKRKLGIHTVLDLSATPFFLRGSGYAEGTLFHWTASDFSLMDAIECGIVKLPRVPVSDNIPGAEMPIYRSLWEHIGKDMPRKSRANAGKLNPADLPPKLRTALETLYGHYEKTFALWEDAGIGVPPCFIVVCSNTAASKLVYDFISGCCHETADGSINVENGKLSLFRNFDEDGNPLARPRTLLIDSHQLESDDSLDAH